MLVLSVLELLFVPVLALSQPSAFSAFPEYIEKSNSASVKRLAGVVGDEPHPLEAKAENFLRQTTRSQFLFDGICTATFVSSEGHALVAHHCLSQLPLEKLGSQHESYLSFRKDLLGVPQKLWFSTKGQFGIPPQSTEFESIRVLAVGRAWPTEGVFRQEGPLEFPELFDDWALIKLDRLPATHQCAQISTQLPSESSVVWGAGYPSLVENTTPTLWWMYSRQLFLQLHEIKDKEKRDELEAAVTKAFRVYMNMIDPSLEDIDPYLLKDQFIGAHDLYVSRGRFFNSFPAARKKITWPFEDGLRAFDSSTLFPKYFFTTVHGSPGMSGGGLFNEDAQLIGLNTALVGGPTIYSFFKLGVMHLSVQHVVEELRKTHSPAQVDTFFRCTAE